MKYLKIQNDGVLDIRLVALMGGTTKNDKYKIGQFGTGLKYTIAYLFRNNVDFKIFSGIEQVKLTTEKETIAGTDFEILCVEGHRTSITTSMGYQWNAWTIVRELWCNALDEGGELKEVVDNVVELAGEENKTTFYIQLLPEIQTVLDEWKAYFIHHKQPIWENENYGIYENDNGGNLKLYKHGVLIYQHPEHKSLFYYDIKGADINELREFKGSVSFDVFNALTNPGKEVISYFLNNVKEEHFEGSQLDYDWFTSFSETWRETIGNQKVSRIGDSSGYSDHGVEVNFSNVIELPKKVYNALVKQFEGIGTLVMADGQEEFFEIPSSTTKHKVQEAIKMLSEAGYEISPTVIIRYGMFREQKQKAATNRNKKTIMISDICQKLEPIQIAAILIEHNEYIVTGFEKDHPKFYRHFIKMFTEKLLFAHVADAQS